MSGSSRCSTRQPQAWSCTTTRPPATTQRRRSLGRGTWRSWPCRTWRTQRSTVTPPVSRRWCRAPSCRSSPTRRQSPLPATPRPASLSPTQQPRPPAASTSPPSQRREKNQTCKTIKRVSTSLAAQSSDESRTGRTGRRGLGQADLGAKKTGRRGGERGRGEAVKRVGAWKRNLFLAQLFCRQILPRE